MVEANTGTYQKGQKKRPGRGHCILTADFEPFMGLGMLSSLTRRNRMRARRRSAGTWDMR